MKNRNILPLLQTCAAYHDAKLLVYVPPPHWAIFNNKPSIEGISRLFAHKLHPGLVELDLDVWLVLPSARCSEKSYSNNEVLRTFADTLGGAHYDHSVDPHFKSIDYFEYGVHSLFHHSTGSVAYIFETAATVFSLCTKILELKTQG
jgi:hypothetical protein